MVKQNVCFPALIWLWTPALSGSDTAVFLKPDRHYVSRTLTSGVRKTAQNFDMDHRSTITRLRTLSMRSILFPIFLSGIGMVSCQADLGINCRGSSYCRAWFLGNNFYTEDVISEFWNALTTGKSANVPGGPISDAMVYDDPQGDLGHIACRTIGIGSEGICLFMQNAGKTNGSVIKARVADLVSHGCRLCGSVPLSGNNHPGESGILTVNYVRSGACHGICGVVPLPIDTA